ncbi:MAG: ABC transporter permease [Actinomycetia bacterium]|nr:ABC transporter permease [Actinomycetes bacterium]
MVERRRRRPRGQVGLLVWLSVAWLLLVVFLAVFAPYLPLPDPNRASPKNALAPIFSDGHLLGTDPLGRDILARLAAAARISVIISMVSVGVGITIGGIIGTTVGYVRGWPERVGVAVTNILLSFPALILLLGVVAMVGRSLTALTSVIAFLAIPGYFRFARARTLALSEEGFVDAARMIGATRRSVVFRELLPNVMNTLITFGLLAVGGVIVAEGTLAFLGLSVPPPQATWGGMIAEGKGVLDRTLHVAVVPSVVMFVTVLSLNLVGDLFRSRLDIKESRL